VSAPDLTDAAVLREDARVLRAVAPEMRALQEPTTRAALALEDVATRLERPAPDLTAHDEAVHTARISLIDRIRALCNAMTTADVLSAEDLVVSSVLELTQQAEARGYARAKMEAQP